VEAVEGIESLPKDTMNSNMWRNHRRQKLHNRTLLKSTATLPTRKIQLRNSSRARIARSLRKTHPNTNPKDKRMGMMSTLPNRNEITDQIRRMPTITRKIKKTRRKRTITTHTLTEDRAKQEEVINKLLRTLREQDNLFEDYYGYVKNDQMDEQRDDGKLMPYRKKDRSEGEQGGKKSEIGSSDNQKSDKPPTFVWKECMICLLKCGSNTPIWTCSECRVSCHLKCIKDWIYKQNNLPVLKNSERDTVFSWSCPHCQNKNKSALPQYFCFCGKLKNPKADVYLEPHSCGKTCGQKKGPLCSHPCSIHCHSGKCPPCEVEIPNLPCFCGKEKKDRKCGEQNRRSCEAVCNKRLACGVHVCQKVCHEGECMPCNVQVSDLKCYCGKTEKTSKCGDRFACESVCSKPLNCGNHQCTKNCHPGYSSANLELVENVP
jgi:hypothetical protein